MQIIPRFFYTQFNHFNPSQAMANKSKVLMEMKAKDPIIGIDFGNRYSYVAVWEDGCVKVIGDGEGNQNTPSWVSFSENGWLLGNDAIQAAIQNYTKTLCDFKLLIEKRNPDDYPWPDSWMKVEELVPRDMIKVTHDGIDNLFSIEGLVSLLLKKLLLIAKNHLKCEVKKAVLTVPTYFNTLQRQAIMDAGVLAGLEVERIINESTAAAIAYGVHKQGSVKEKVVVVFCLGSCSLDITLLGIRDGVFKTKATAHDPGIGGEHFVSRIIAHLIAANGLIKTIWLPSQWRANCERAMCHLSFYTATTILSPIWDFGAGDFIPLSRDQFEDICDDLFRKCMDLLVKCLMDGKTKKDKVDEIVLAGGSTNIPKIQQLLEDFFGKKLCKNINPEEVIAYGAAIQAAILRGEDSGNVVISEVTSHSLGYKDENLMIPLITKNTKLPAKMDFSCKITEPSMIYEVYAGESLRASENTLVGRFVISGIATPQSGMICFTIDVNGILHVTTEVKGAEDQSNKITFDNEIRWLPLPEMTLITQAENELKRKVEEEKTALETYAGNRRIAMDAKAKSDLTNSMFALRSFINEAKRMEEPIKKTIQWMNENPGAKADECHRIREELEGDCCPEIDSIHTTTSDSRWWRVP